MRYEIINIRKREMGITNAQLSDLTGITLSTLDKITSGANQNPKLATLKAIAKAIGCTLDDFDDEFTSNTNDIASAYAAAPVEVKRNVSAMLSSYNVPRLHEGLSPISLLILFESADVRVKNQIISILVDHANDKLMNDSHLDEAHEKARDYLIGSAMVSEGLSNEEAASSATHPAASE